MGELPGQQVRVVGQGVHVGFGLQEVGQTRTPGQGAYGLPVFAQCPYE
ncbi:MULTISPECIES: hypothetical protein [unclassified Streptomyces]